MKKGAENVPATRDLTSGRKTELHRSEVSFPSGMYTLRVPPCTLPGAPLASLVQLLVHNLGHFIVSEASEKPENQNLPFWALKHEADKVNGWKKKGILCQ